MFNTVIFTIKLKLPEASIIRLTSLNIFTLRNLINGNPQDHNLNNDNPQIQKSLIIFANSKLRTSGLAQHCLIAHKKTACGSSVKTILGKTFAGSPVNACSVEPESVLKKENLIKMSILHAPVIRKDSIQSLFQRFVFILRVHILENIIVLSFKKCPYFWRASSFCFI